MKSFKALLAVLLCVVFFSNVRAEEENEGSVFNLNEVVVTGTKCKRILKDVPIETSVVTRSEMEKAGIQNAADAIRLVPGLSISGGAPFGGNRRLTGLLRGLPAHYSLLLIDGRRTKSEHIHTGINMNLLPVEMIERIEVIKGPASALYGSEAFGGVINILTRKYPEKHLFNMDGSFGTFNTKSMGMTYGLGTDKLDLILSGKMTNTDAFDDNGYRQRNVMAKTRYSINDNNAIDVNVKEYLNSYIKSGSWVTDSLFDCNMGWKKEIDKNEALDVSGYFCRFDQDAKATTNISMQVDTLYHNEVSEDHSLTAGCEVRRETFMRTATPYNGENIFSAFVEEEIGLSDKVDYVAALRVDKHPDLNAIFTPKLNVLYRAGMKTRLRAEAGTGFRAPSLQDRYEYHYWHKTYWRDGNADLKPEYSVSFNLGIEQDIIVDRFLGRLSIFRNDLTDMISTTRDLGNDPDDGKPVIGRENLASAYTQGIELEFRCKVIESLEAIVSYNYLDTADDDGDVLSYNPQHSFNANLYCDVEQIGLGLQLSLETALNRFYQDKSGVVQSLSDYTLINLNLVKNLSDNFNIYVTASNILNQAFESYEEGAAELSFGRTVNIGIKYKM